MIGGFVLQLPGTAAVVIKFYCSGGTVVFMNIIVNGMA